MKNLFEFMEPARLNKRQVHLTNVARVLSGMLSEEVYQSGAADERGSPKMNDDRDDEMETSGRDCISHEQRSALTRESPSITDARPVILPGP